MTKTKTDWQFTTIPHWILRDFMLYANHVQLKLVLYVCDQTFGWRDQYGNPKPYEETTTGVIARNLGVSRSRLSANLQPLINDEIIYVNDQWGKPLDTPAKRKANGIAKRPMRFSVRTTIYVSKQDKSVGYEAIAVFLGDRALPAHGTGERSDLGHNKRNVLKKPKERELSDKKTDTTTYRCEKCGGKADGMDLVKSKLKKTPLLCGKCSKISLTKK